MPDQILFIGIAVLVLGSGIGMLLVKNTVYSALLLVFNFLNVALIYLFLGAPFIALTQITVYAGAIMVLFLFVIMLLGAESVSQKEPLRGQRFFSFFLAALFIVEMVLVFTQRNGLGSGKLSTVVFVSPAQIGKALFTEYALPFEMTAAILLAATIGAVLITHKDKKQRASIEKNPVEHAEEII
ncbi:MAG: NADH-quinone oxidoreductase subunit J [Anaerolineaceae bacterium]|nr:NADH-quinone oxidoreductase subunit J [Anaerolineaceae bacterium]